jgi:transcription elongation GreA/GreB family factor
MSVVITPGSILGRSLLGKVCGDELHTDSGAAQKNFTIVAVS